MKCTVSVFIFLKCKIIKSFPELAVYFDSIQVRLYSPACPQEIINSISYNYVDMRLVRSLFSSESKIFLLRNSKVLKNLFSRTLF